MSDLWTACTIAALALITVLTRSFFFLSERPWTLPRWIQRGLQYAPIAALVAVIAPEIVMHQGALIDDLRDARIFGALAGVLYFVWRRGSKQAVLGTIVGGMAVYLPLHLGLGW